MSELRGSAESLRSSGDRLYGALGGSSRLMVSPAPSLPHTSPEDSKGRENKMSHMEPAARFV